MIKRTLTAAGLVVLAAASAGIVRAAGVEPGGEAPSLSGSRPNIIVFLADDLSYWDISHFGQEEFSTPHLDRMAREGMVFANAYAASPQCASSRGGLLTGLHMGRSPIRRNGTDVRPELHARPYLTDQETLADVLRRAGYATCHVGKWHAGEPGTPGMPHLQGFETTLSFCHSLHPRALLNQQYTYPDRLWHNGRQVAVPENRGFRWEHGDNRFDAEGRFVPGGVEDPSKARHGEEIFLEKALEFIRQPREKPFFLYYATPLPHSMWPNELRELKDKGPPWTINQKKWAGQVTQLDRSLGAIVEAVKAEGIDNNTIIIFASDNGYSAWGYSIPRRPRWQDDPVLRNKGPWDRGKFIHAHGGVIVPFMAWGPGLVGTGETNRAVVQYDFKSTFADLAGEAPQQPTDGASFAALLAGQEDRYPKRPFLYWEQGDLAATGQSVLLDERFFALRSHPNEPVELYDIFEDVGCDNNIAADRPDLVRRAQSRFVSEHEAHPWYTRLTKALQETRNNPSR